MSKELEQLKRQYKSIPIPNELDFVVKNAIWKSRKRHMITKRFIGIGAAVIILIAATVTGISTNPAFANALSEVPVIGSLIKVFTVKEFKINEETSKAEIEVPAITNLDNKSLEATLNNKYLEESTELYKTFMADMEELKKDGGGHTGVKSGYDVKTDNDQILSIGRYVVSTVNSYSQYKFDTIDKKKQLLITLPSLFKDDKYISLISANIKEQMKQQMKADPDKEYWGKDMDGFETLVKDQSFYINKESKLVIFFDKYEVAPGYMGAVEFIIPTKVIADDLVSNEYIK